jgi:hypothetical protein
MILLYIPLRATSSLHQGSTLAFCRVPSIHVELYMSKPRLFLAPNRRKNTLCLRCLWPLQSKDQVLPSAGSELTPSGSVGALRDAVTRDLLCFNFIRKVRKNMEAKIEFRIVLRDTLSVECRKSIAPVRLK